MRVLFISDNFPPEVNAPALRTYEHAKRWAADGVDVAVITCAPNIVAAIRFRTARPMAHVHRDSGAMEKGALPNPTDVASVYRERAETLVEMAEGARYCYEDFAEIDPKAAKKNLRPFVLVPFQAARILEYPSD